MVSSTKMLWRTSLRLGRSIGGLTVCSFALAVLLRTAPAVAQNATPLQNPPGSGSYQTTWSRGALPASYYATTWQSSPAARVPSTAARIVVPGLGPALTAPNGPVHSGIIRISAQVKARETDSGERPTLFGKPEVFRLESERRLRERAQAEAKTAGKQPLPFPTDPTPPPVDRPRPSGRPTVASIEPTYLCYERLMFEEKNSEHYGWDLGPIGVLISPTDFYWKVLTAPLARLADPCRSFEANVGYCLPGDPVPYRLRLTCSGSNR